MKAVSLTRGLVAFVSDEDWDAVSQHRWHAHPMSRSRGGHYAATRIGKKTTYMHRFILKPGAGQIVDHVDGDGLNNTRQNIRLANYSGNSANRTTKNKHGLRGVNVHRRKVTVPFRAEVTAVGCRWVGPYRANPIQAAIDYDRKIVELLGEFARPNFPCLFARSEGGDA